jgi:YVTN family beta-propeller protein
MSPQGKSGATAAVLAAVFSLGLLCSGCGDVFRPVANPVPQPGGDPQRTAHALVVSSNGSSPGTAVDIDTTGDTNVGIFNVGRNPVHASGVTGINYVVNRDDDSVATFTLLSIGNPPAIITLPAGARPVFVAPAGGKVFVAESGLAAVADISVNNTVTRHIPVGSQPVALVAIPDGTKLYCLNKNDGTVSVILPATDQVVATITVGSTPVWGAVSSDGSRVFVVNQGSNTVSVIDTTTGPTTDTVINTLNVGAGPNYIVYQSSQNRAYVTSPAANSLTIIENATGAAPTVTVRSLAGAPCNGQHPSSLTALRDGTRVYVADDTANSVCVLNTTSNSFTKSIAVGTTPVFIASDPDSTRVLTANSGSSDVSLIQTSNDTTVKRADGTTPLTISTGGTPTFIAITP